MVLTVQSGCTAFYPGKGIILLFYLPPGLLLLCFAFVCAIELLANLQQRNPPKWRHAATSPRNAGGMESLIGPEATSTVKIVCSHSVEIDASTFLLGAGKSATGVLTHQQGVYPTLATTERT